MDNPWKCGVFSCKSDYSIKLRAKVRQLQYLVQCLFALYHYYTWILNCCLKSNGTLVHNSIQQVISKALFLVLWWSVYLLSLQPLLILSITFVCVSMQRVHKSFPGRIPHLLLMVFHHTDSHFSGLQVSFYVLHMLNAWLLCML